MFVIFCTPLNLLTDFEQINTHENSINITSSRKRKFAQEIFIVERAGSITLQDRDIIIYARNHSKPVPSIYVDNLFVNVNYMGINTKKKSVAPVVYKFDPIKKNEFAHIASHVFLYSCFCRIYRAHIFRLQSYKNIRFKNMKSHHSRKYAVFQKRLI